MISPTPSPGPQRWQRLRQSTLASTRIFELQSVVFRHPGRTGERDFVVIDAPDWVNVIAHTRDDRLVLVRQFRYGIDEFSLEIPGGIIEPEEDVTVAAARELQEETGYTGTRVRLLGSVHPNPAIQSNRTHFVLVEDAVQSHAHGWDEDEEIEVTTLPVADVFALVGRGAITHALVLNALWFFERDLRVRSG